MSIVSMIDESQDGSHEGDTGTRNADTIEVKMTREDWMFVASIASLLVSLKRLL